ncbi:DUF916 domain-containing protein [Apilactobacillus micheneri]|uniref:WxL protein peptidoglycan domain-containing protein n=1 Tax=Apilactobacillus micheneri TaxID=1899430 RepID=UPI00112EA93A|nr:DUF916 domain-containing protein [Apilactobacillus micheneri]TPR42845.1 DUF916 domain-containing protein [Apilactobacillus micheneri]TPR47169.1 DUF916 domain-containing protein [Apilactobacillus micheneri]
MSIKFIKANIFVFFVASILFFIVSFNANASEKYNYSSVPLLSGLPVDTNSSYFKLNVDSYTHYDIPLLITNNTNHYVKTKTYIRGASTTEDGNISYNKINNPVSKQIINKHVIATTLKPHSNKVIKYKLYTNQDEFKGTQLAGIVTLFYKDGTKGINNNVSYTNGLELTEKRKKLDIHKLSFDRFYYDDNNHAYKIKIRNKTPELFNNMNIKVVVNNSSFSRTYRLKNISVTPNSSFYIKMPVQDAKIHKDDLNIFINNKNIFSSNKKIVYFYMYW